MLTKEEFKRKIRYGSTIYNSCRKVTLKDGYTLSVISCGNITKNDMDDILYERYLERCA